MSYERAFGVGDEEVFSPDDILKQDPSDAVVVNGGEQAPPPLDPIESAGNGQSSNGLAVAGVLGILGGLALFAILLPFGIGAVSGAVIAPSGRRKAAAKSGAWAGGIGGFVAYPLIYGVTGNTPLATRLAGIAPMVLGGYMGYRERQKEELY